MEYNHFLKNCRDDDVISLSEKLYKLEEVKQCLSDFFETRNSYCASNSLRDKTKNVGIDIDSNQIFSLLTEGIDSEILKIASSGWQKGKLKINVSVEFIPDQPEIPEYQSPLDEIRNHPSFSNTQ